MKVNSFRIKVLLAEKEESCAKLASKAGISKQSMSAVLNRGTCSHVTAGKIARALGVDVLDILEVTE